jgi:ABC-type uncharacterized transport system permease subunit
VTPDVTFTPKTTVIAALLAYAMASLLYVAGTTRFFRFTAHGLVAAGVILLSVSAQDQLITTGNWAASAGPMLAAMIGAGAIAADRWLGVRLVPVMLVPFGMLVLLVRVFAAPTPHMVPTPWITGFHVTTALAGQVMAIAACVLSILYLWQHRALKQRRIMELGSRIPSLERLDEWLRIALVTGFVTLTLSLVTGALFMTALPYGIAPGSSPQPSGAMLVALRAKVMWAVAVWSWYLATLVARNILRSPVRVIARMSVAGFALISIAWFGLLFITSRPNLAIPLAG